MQFILLYGIGKLSNVRIWPSCSDSPFKQGLIV